MVSRKERIWDSIMEGMPEVDPLDEDDARHRAAFRHFFDTAFDAGYSIGFEAAKFDSMLGGLLGRECLSNTQGN